MTKTSYQQSKTLSSLAVGGKIVYIQKLKILLELLWKEIIYGGHITAFASIGVVIFSALILNIKITYSFLVVVYLGTLSSYIYNRHIEFENDFLTNFERSLHLKNIIRYVPYLWIISFSLIIIITFYLSNLFALLFAIFLFSSGTFYTTHLKKITKTIIGFKSFFVALIWSLLVIFLAVYHSYYYIDISFVLIMLFVYTRMLLHSSFFDIKDIKIDSQHHLQTFPIIFSGEKIYFFLNLLNIISLVPIIIGIFTGVLPFSSLFLVFLVPFSFTYIYLIIRKKSNISYWSQIAISSEKMIWPLLILISKLMF